MLREAFCGSPDFSFQDKKDEVTEKIPCIDANGGDDCSSSPANETNEAGDQEKILMQIIGSNAPVRPGILVQRQNKVVTSLGNREGTEAEKEVKMKDRQGPEDSGEVNQEDENLQETLIPSVTESQKRPLKGVTFSREVIIVNLGNEQHPAHQRYAQEHKERRKSPKRHKRKGNINTE
ncbi:hypothetical protein GW7_01330 [Heterocephalus glaber]|uniref:Uncharacterized protein n=1 Tax=Heterocephalus glaber TaxID=10181 RepID=G5C1Z2_HETGA|nr:hypothetical protein GW7_01330 [Heterocephalus glaber]